MQGQGECAAEAPKASEVREPLEKRASPVGVIGIDLSLTRPAAVYLPPNWSPANLWRGVSWMSLGEKLVEAGFSEDKPRFTAERLRFIAVELLNFVRRVGAKHVAMEDHAYHAGRGGAMAGAELHGAVKFCFYEMAGIVVQPVNIMTARKLFLGTRMPGKGARELVHEELGRLDPPWRQKDGQVPSDEGDALLVASYLRSSLGLVAMVVG